MTTNSSNNLKTDDLMEKNEVEDEYSPLLVRNQIIADSTPSLTIIVIAGHLASIIGSVLLSLWVLCGQTEKKFLGGFTWFNLHPLFMVWTFGFLVPTGVLMQRYTTPELSKKWFSILHLLAMFTSSIALTGVFISHNYPSNGQPIPNLYSAHSLAGLLLLFLFYAQTVFFVFFYYSKHTIPYRYQWTPYHKQIAAWVMVFAVGVMISGIARKQAFIDCTYTRPLIDDHGNNMPDYNPFGHTKWLPLGCRLANWSAVFLLAGSFITVVGLSK